MPLTNHGYIHAPLSTGFSAFQEYCLRTDSLWRFLHLLTKLTIYTCSNLEEKWDYSNHFASNTLSSVVDLNIQPQAASVLRFQTPASDSSRPESPQSSLQVIEAGQVSKCFALSNENPERHVGVPFNGNNRGRWFENIRPHKLPPHAHRA